MCYAHGSYENGIILSYWLWMILSRGGVPRCDFLDVTVGTFLQKKFPRRIEGVCRMKIWLEGGQCVSVSVVVTLVTIPFIQMVICRVPLSSILSTSSTRIFSSQLIYKWDLVRRLLILLTLFNANFSKIIQFIFNPFSKINHFISFFNSPTSMATLINCLIYSHLVSFSFVGFH